MNIYRRLGARLTTLGGDSTPPCVYGDGSTCEETKKWAMNLLGFNDGVSTDKSAIVTERLRERY